MVQPQPSTVDISSNLAFKITKWCFNWDSQKRKKKRDISLGY